jgi:hypothetical protein
MSSADLQSQIRLGRPEDLYYYSESSLRKQTIPTFQNTQFLQNISPTNGSGNYQIIFSKNNGVSHVVIGAKLKKQNDGVAGEDYTGIAVGRGWLANLISRCSYRVAGASQYWQTGQQMLIANCLESTSATTKQDMVDLAGSAMTTTADFKKEELLYAYLYFNMPFNKPYCGTESPLPLPTELLNSNLVLSIDLNPLSSIYSSVNAGGSVADAPNTLENLYVQFQQIQAVDGGDLMKMTGDTSKIYSLPCKGFYTAENTISIPAGTDLTPDLNLVGFQSGQVKAVICWLTANVDTAPNVAAAHVRNNNCFAYGRDWTLKYNGQIIHQFQGTSSTMWGQLMSDVPPYFDAVRLDISGSAILPRDERSNFVFFPLGQNIEGVNPHLLVNGRSIGTAIMNLQVRVPNPAVAYTLHVMYLYNTVLAINGAGDASFMF